MTKCSQETAHDCLALVERHCARLMITGDGPIKREQSYHRISRERRQRIVELHRAGISIREIAERMGISRGAAAYHCRLTD